MESLVVGIIALVVGGLIGVPIGIFIGMERMRKAVEKRSVGNLRIDRSEPDEPPRPFLEVTGATIESIAREEFIILKVVNKNYISPN
jgi:hypothetical protein